MTKDEALKMAIEVLWSVEEYDKTGVNISKKAINACKEALKQPAQEPVAWIDDDVIVENKWECYSKNPEPLYTHPHQWQGLTDDEIDKIIEKHKLMWMTTDFARAIEQALKDKNT
jgi:hypothetical protein